MNDWKTQLYEKYVSSGQASCADPEISKPSLKDQPYFHALIRNHLPPKKTIAIADVACGHGALLCCLKEAGYFKISGVDVSPEQIQIAHRWGMTEASCGDMNGFLQDKTDAYDVIFLMDILEHLERAELFALLGSVNRALKSNGRIIIHVPNAEGLYGMRIRYGDLTHENCFTPQSMRQALVSSGFGGICCYEDKPLVHGIKSLVRRILWDVMTVFPRMLMIAETGQTKPVLSQNILVVAVKAAGKG